MFFYKKEILNILSFFLFVFSSNKVYAMDTSDVIRGSVIMGVSSQVTVMNYHEAPIHVEKTFTSSSGQLLVGSSMIHNAVVTLANERGATIQISRAAERRWSVYYSGTGTIGSLYDSSRCPYVGASTGVSSTISFDGLAARTECYYRHARGADTVNYTKFHLGAKPGYTGILNWDLISPPSEPGLYRGVLDVTLGPGRDIDMGPEAIYHTDRIEIPFEVYVSAIPMRMKFPPGSEFAVLAPQDGWSSWIGRGVKPSRIYRDITFSINTQGFMLATIGGCSNPSGEICQITDGDGHFANLNIMLTLPDPWRKYGNGNSVSRHAITTSRASYANLLTAGHMPVTSSGKLTVEVSGAELDKMMASPGSEWTGNVTIIFEQPLSR